MEFSDPEEANFETELEDKGNRKRVGNSGVSRKLNPERKTKTFSRKKTINS